MSFGNQLSRYPALKAYVESLCSIPAGTFQMGCASGYIIEKPVHSVMLSAFRMAATPVTVAVWKEYCAATGTKLPAAPSWGLLDDHPVVNVSWNDIMGSDGKGGFCAWASDIAGFRLTLPTEAQFEYAARGGQSWLEYPWGNGFDDSKVWCSKSNDRKSTAPVTRSSNVYRYHPYGLTDMSGNVLQWCYDVHGLYSSSAQKDPIGDIPRFEYSLLWVGNYHNVRGGSWEYDGEPHLLRCARRDFRRRETTSADLGFRLATGPG